MIRSRRQVLTTAALAFPAVVGRAGQATAPLDEAMAGLLHKWGIPGAALGIARAGRIAFAKGYGLADQQRGTAVTVESKFRLASVSKPITCAAILRLAEQGQLSLDEAVLPKLNLEPLNGVFGDARWGRVTARHLLQHSGGWRKGGGDPMFRSPQICAETGCAAPADAVTTVRWMLGRRLDFEPGSAYDYCNFGYCVLGRLIEAITGQDYEAAVQKLVLGPVGASGIRLGRSLSALPGEVAYHHNDGTLGPSVFPQHKGLVPLPYGSFSMEANDANGGWIANVGDYLRFLMAHDESSGRPLLKASSLDAIYQGAAPGSVENASYQGLGWLVRPKGQGGRPNLWHVGGLPGTKTIAVRLGDAFDWCVFFNSRPAVYDAFNHEVQNTIHAAARKVTTW
jgi:CubicO group peptidase (beta-lactamase class C family)